MKNWFQAFDFKLNLYRYTMDQRIVVVIDSWPAESPYPEGHYVKSLGKLGGVVQNGCQNGCTEWLYRTVVQNGCTERLCRTVVQLLNPVDPQLESAWFQPLNVKCDLLGFSKKSL